MCIRDRGRLGSGILLASEKKIKENNLGSVGNLITDAAILDTREILCESTRFEYVVRTSCKIYYLPE